MPTDASDNGPPPAAAPPKEMEGQVVSTDRAKLLSEANTYATTKSVTQVIFTTSAIASNVTLWNQLDHRAWRFGALNALIWTSVALNVFVILLATYLSFQPPIDKEAAAREVEARDAAAKDRARFKDLESGTGGAARPLAHRTQRMHRSKVGQFAHDFKEDLHGMGEEARRRGEGCCCWIGGTHHPYHGDAVELCGIRVYSRNDDVASWACCDLGCCALFRVVGTGEGLGMLSVEPSEEQKHKHIEQKRHFMDYKSHLLNEVIGILAVLIVIMNVIISAMAASTK